MKTVQVFDMDDLGHELWEELAVHWKAANDSYHRFYPDKPPYGMRMGLFSKTTRALLCSGMKINKSDKHFYVLIRIDW